MRKKHKEKVVSLQAGVDLLPESVLVVRVPVGASLVKLARRRHDDLLGRLDELHAETLADVPCDVAVEQPASGVVGRESNRHPAATRKSSGVTAGRSSPVHDSSAGIVDTPSLADDEVIVAVKMHGVRNWRKALDGLDHPVVPLAFAGGWNDVQLGRVLGVAVHEVLESRGLPVHVDGAGVDRPDGESITVRLELGTSEVDVHGLVGEGSDGNGLLPVRSEVSWFSADSGLSEGTA